MMENVILDSVSRSEINKRTNKINDLISFHYQNLISFLYQITIIKDIRVLEFQ